MDIGLRVRGHYRKDGPNSPFSGRGLSVQGGSLSIIVSLWRFRCYLIIGTSSLISGKLVNNRLSITLLSSATLFLVGWVQWNVGSRQEEVYR